MSLRINLSSPAFGLIDHDLNGSWTYNLNAGGTINFYNEGSQVTFITLEANTYFNSTDIGYSPVLTESSLYKVKFSLNAFQSANFSNFKTGLTSGVNVPATFTITWSDTESTTTTTTTSAPTTTTTSAPTTTTTTTTTTTSVNNMSNRLYLWGDNSAFQIGNTIDGYRPSPLLIASSINTVDAGGYHTIGTSGVNRTYVGCGDNSHYQLTNFGADNTTSLKSPLRSITNNLPANIIQAEAGLFHSLYLTSGGQIYAIGNNNFSQTSFANNIYGPYVKIAAGNYHNIAVNTMGQVYIWGRNNYGQIGSNNTGTFGSILHEIFKNVGVKDIAAGDYHTAIITLDGKLWLCGLNNRGQIGDNTNNIRTSFVSIGGTLSFYKVSLGTQHSAAIDINGNLYTWGDNSYGQLGRGNLLSNFVPTAVSRINGHAWTEVSAGNGYTLAINANGDIYAWGWNNSGQLGDGTQLNKSSPIKVNNNISGTPVAIKAGSGYHSAALFSDISVTTTTTTTANPIDIAYIANFTSGTISIINGATNSLIQTLSVGNGPFRLAVNNITNRLYVAHQSVSSVFVIDTSSNELITSVAIGSALQGIAINPITNRIYVSSDTNNIVSVIDGNTNTVLANISTGGSFIRDIAINTVTNKIYVASYGSNSVIVINGNNNTIEANIIVGANPSNPIGIEVNEVTNKIYVCNNTGNSVAIINGINNTLIKSINLDPSPTSVAINTITNKIYITRMSDIFGNIVSIIDGNTDTLIYDIRVGDRLFDLDIHNTNNKIYISDWIGSKVHILEGTNDTIVDSIPIGTNPAGVTVLEGQAITTTTTTTAAPTTTTVAPTTTTTTTTAVLIPPPISQNNPEYWNIVAVNGNIGLNCFMWLERSYSSSGPFTTVGDRQIGYPNTQIIFNALSFISSTPAWFRVRSEFFAGASILYSNVIGPISLAATTTTTTTTTLAPIGPNTANFNNCADWNSQDVNVTTVGSNGGPSAYGTYDQSGNIEEWTDAGVVRTGDFTAQFALNISSIARTSAHPRDRAVNSLGFRIASSVNPLNLNYFVDIQNTNNINDTTGYGAIDYNYKIGQYTVTVCEYVEFLNAVAKTDTYGLYKQSIAGIDRVGLSANYIYSVSSNSNMANKPVVITTWFDAARYCNWLHNGKPSGSQGNGTTETGAYTLNGATNGNAVIKNSGAAYWIPTENEWYKAAYYSPNKNGSGSPGYYIYATQSDTVPTCVSANTMGDGPVASSYVCVTTTTTTTTTPTVTTTTTAAPTTTTTTTTVRPQIVGSCMSRGSFSKIQLRRATNAQFISANTILASGEPGYATDTRVIKVGDGYTPWSALLPVNISGTIDFPTLLASNNINISSVGSTYIIAATGLALSDHGHDVNDITGLSGVLSNLQPSGNYAPLNHQHTINDITNFNPSGHKHVVADIEGLDLNNIPVGPHSHSVGDIYDISSYYSPIGHTHLLSEFDTAPIYRTNIHTIYPDYNGYLSVSWAKDQQIQRVTLDGNPIMVYKSTGWPGYYDNYSVDVLLEISIPTDATSVDWTSMVNGWYSQPPEPMPVGTHLVLLRAMGDSVDGHYIGSK